MTACFAGSTHHSCARPRLSEVVCVCRLLSRRVAVVRPPRLMSMRECRLSVVVAVPPSRARSAAAACAPSSRERQPTAVAQRSAASNPLRRGDQAGVTCFSPTNPGSDQPRIQPRVETVADHRAVWRHLPPSSRTGSHPLASDKTGGQQGRKEREKRATDMFHACADCVDHSLHALLQRHERFPTVDTRHFRQSQCPTV